MQQGGRAALEGLLMKENAVAEEPRHGEKEMDGDGDDDLYSLLIGGKGEGVAGRQVSSAELNRGQRSRGPTEADSKKFHFLFLLLLYLIYSDDD